MFVGCLAPSLMCQHKFENYIAQVIIGFQNEEVLNEVYKLIKIETLANYYAI